MIKTVKVDRALQIQLMHLKGRIKRSDLCGALLIRGWWHLKRQLYAARDVLGHYPLANTSNEGYYVLPEEQLDLAITTNLSEAHLNGISCVASELDFYTKNFKDIFVDMIEPLGTMERKSWEFVMATLGLRELNAFGPNKKGLGIGSGCEKPLFYYSRFSKEVIGTDLYLDNNSDWQHTAHSDILANPAKYAPFSYPENHLKLMHMNAMDLEFPDNTFDYAFSFSAIEHFGTRNNIHKTMKEIERVLKPGGTAAITTELILNKDVNHHEYFTVDELQKHMIESHGLELIGDLDLRLSKKDLQHILDFDTHMARPIGIIFKSGKVIYTPVLLFFRKRK